MNRRSSIAVFMRLLSMLGNLRYVMIFAVLFGVLGFLASTFISVLGVKAILQALASNYEWGATLCLFMLALGFLRGVFRYIEQMANHYIAFKLLATIRDIVFSSLRRVAPAKLEKKDKGNLISVITSDIELLEVFYAHTISPVLIAIIMGVIMIGYIGSISKWLILPTFLGFVSIGYVLPIFIKKRGGTLADEYREKQGKLSGFVLDSLRGLGEIHQYDCAEERLDSINALTDEISDVELRFKRTSSFSMALTNYVIIAFNLLFLSCVSFLFHAGILGFDEAILSFVAFISSYGPFIAVANLGFTLQNTIAAANRVIDIIDEEPLVNDVVGAKSVLGDVIDAKNVSFAYADVPVLENVSLQLKKNNIIGIMGKSGSGKSTLLRLLMRFWKINSGNIMVDDVDIEEVNTKNLRDMQAFVTQDVMLFNESIFENVRLANLDASLDEVIEACKKANLHEFVESLPLGYDTVIGELGDRLSGGERQRIGIARAFLHSPKFLFLDESTSNLDSLNEAIILNSIYKEARDKAVLIVSHRSSTLKIADAVYEMKDGSLK